MYFYGILRIAFGKSSEFKWTGSSKAYDSSLNQFWDRHRSYGQFGITKDVNNYFIRYYGEHMINIDFIRK